MNKVDWDNRARFYSMRCLFSYTSTVNQCRKLFIQSPNSKNNLHCLNKFVLMRFCSPLNYTQYSHVHFKWALKCRAREKDSHILESTEPPPTWTYTSGVKPLRRGSFRPWWKQRASSTRISWKMHKFSLSSSARLFSLVVLGDEVTMMPYSQHFRTRTG